MQSKTAQAPKVPTQEEAQAFIQYTHEVLQTPILGVTYGHRTRELSNKNTHS